jgi:hypothetical protein
MTHTEAVQLLTAPLAQENDMGALESYLDARAGWLTYCCVERLDATQRAVIAARQQEIADALQGLRAQLQAQFEGAARYRTSSGPSATASAQRTSRRF